MTTDITVSAHEDILRAAWNEYSDRARDARGAFDNPRLTLHQKMDAHKNAITAHERFRVLFLAPTPEHLWIESGRLFAEGFVLLALVCGFIGLFLPDLEINFWPLAITVVIVGALGGWSVHYLGRVVQHLGRRI